MFVALSQATPRFYLTTVEKIGRRPVPLILEMVDFTGIYCGLGFVKMSAYTYFDME